MPDVTVPLGKPSNEEKQSPFNTKDKANTRPLDEFSGLRASLHTFLAVQESVRLNDLNNVQVKTPATALWVSLFRSMIIHSIRLFRVL